MKVIINGEEFILSEEKCKGQNLDLKVCGFYLDLNYMKDKVHTFSSNSEGILERRLIAWELLTSNGNEACVPLIINDSKITPELFFQELKEKIAPYLTIVNTNLIVTLKKSIVDTFEKYGDDTVLRLKGRSYSGIEIAEEVKNETQFGVQHIESLIRLTIDLIKRDKINIED